ncbi:MAG TPA: large conductance mechanosensitive channel protein MscL [Thermoanaerobaculia bacterium]|nr:large conductance mechanosensitive channel protein MscL [Thermoanaerobaculia bacterium]
MFREFKEFALRGNVVDMAIGILVGGAFTPIARSLVDDVFMPPLGLLLGGIDFEDFFVLLRDGVPPGPYTTLEAAQAAGAVTVNYGRFVNLCLTFLLVALAAFLLVRAMNRLRRREEGTDPKEAVTRNCPFCLSSIPVRARRCPQCTSELPAGEGGTPPGTPST